MKTILGCMLSILTIVGMTFLTTGCDRYVSEPETESPNPMTGETEYPMEDAETSHEDMDHDADGIPTNPLSPNPATTP